MSEKEIEKFDWINVSETIDLGVTAQTIDVTVKNFDMITRISIMFNHSDAAMEWTEFAAGGALTNGFYLIVDGKEQSATIKTKAQLANFGDLFISPTDLDAATVSYVLQAVKDLTKVCYPLGGIAAKKIDGYRKVQFVIGDDMSGLTGVLTAVVEGWRGE